MKKVLSIILAVMMIVCMIPVTVLSVSAEVEEEVTYVDRYWDADEGKVVEETKTVMAKPIEAGTTKLDGGWYFVSEGLTISEQITVGGTADNPTRIILTDDYTLEASKGMIVNGGSVLVIYGQAKETGTLTSTSASSDAGIGGGYKKETGTIIINGGIVNGRHHMNYNGAGIGGGYYSTGGSVTINGGKVTASGGSNSAGIGNAYQGTGCIVTINGGTVDATGGKYSAGIGDSYKGVGCTVTINGGEVTATSGSNSAGIGGGYTGTGGGTITITGGTVTATGAKYGAGIGSGYNGTCGTVTITGGSVTAAGGQSAAGIGGGSGRSCGTITITGGTVTATGGQAAAGIGGGSGGAGGTVTITGGTVTATGAVNTAGIGAGYNGSSQGSLDAVCDIIKAGSAAPGEATEIENYLNARSRYVYLHTHTYDCSTAADAYLKSDATFTHGAVYYKSCVCGACDKSGNAATFEAVETLTLSDCFLLGAVEYGLQIGRQGKLGEDDSIDDEVGRTIIPLTPEQLGEIGDSLTIIANDGTGDFLLEVDCVYTYFYDVTDGVETKYEAGVDDLADFAAFIIIDNNGEGGPVTGYGYFRVYNGEEIEDNFMFDALYPGGAPAEPIVFGDAYTNEVINPVVYITAPGTEANSLKKLLATELQGKLSVEDVISDKLKQFLLEKGLNESDVEQEVDKWINKLSTSMDVETLMWEIDATFPNMFTVEEFDALSYDLLENDVAVPVYGAETITIPENGRIELTIGNYRYFGQNGEWVYALADGATEPYGQPCSVIAGYPVVGSAR